MQDDDWDYGDDDDDGCVTYEPPDYGFTPKQLRAIRDKAVWENARADYLAGETAEVVCERYDLAVGTLKHRAANEGWRRIDQPDPPPRADAGPEPDDDTPVDVAVLAEQALARVRRAVARGRSGEAGSWMRLYEKLARLAAASSPAEPPPPAAPDPVDAVMAVARGVEAVARAAADTPLDDAASTRRIEAQMAQLDRLMDALQPAPLTEHGSVSDPSDPVFPGRRPARCRSYEGCSPGDGLRSWGCEAPTSTEEFPG